jgi:hypothetical protein
VGLQHVGAGLQQVGRGEQQLAAGAQHDFFCLQHFAGLQHEPLCRACAAAPVKANATMTNTTPANFLMMNPRNPF